MAHARLPMAGMMAALFLLAGCAIGPNYQRPAVAAPAAFRGEAAASGAASLADLAWWDIYRDEQLRELIRGALTEGYDGRVAAARVEQYQAIAAQVHGLRFPGVGYAANADRGRNAQLGNAFTQGNGVTSDGFDAYLGVAWEFDLWGRVRRLDESARAQYLATEEARRGVVLTLVSDVATAYFNLLELDEELAIAQRSTQTFGDSLKLFNQRLEGGVSSRLETASAEAATATSASRIPDLERQIALAENLLSLLTGRNPAPVARSARLTDEAIPPEVPAGLPAALLERRPDVRRAEAAVRAANAQIGVVEGSFLPRIGLSAIFGAVSPQLDNLTTSKASLWSAGANLTGPLFQGGGLHGQYQQARAAWDEARLQYQQAALNAFREVADILITRQKLVEVRVQQERAVRAYEEAVKVSRQRYSAGKASYYEVLQAQQLLFPAEVGLAQTRRNQLTAIVQLYRALGGGWKLADQDWGARPEPGHPH